MPPLQGWENFYVIVGSSAAALTGLQFVVMALIVDNEHIGGGEDTVRAFATPTIVHFTAVLLIGAICSMPGHTLTTLATCLLSGGVAGVVYQIFVIRESHRQTGYKPVFEDWLFFATLPTVAYGVLLIAGALEFRDAAGPLYGVAVAALLLMLVGIHNSWDTAVYIASARRRTGEEPRA